MFETPKYIHLKTLSLKIAVHDTGDAHSETQAVKPVLFFVHGLGLNSLLWKYAVQHLMSDFRCIAIDLPGHGNSWDQRGNFSMSFYAQVLRSTIEEMRLNDITLVGHSMGGQISAITALQMQAVVNRLVLVSSAGVETFTDDEANKIIQGAEFLYKTPADISAILGMYTPHFSMHADRVRELADDHILQTTERFSLFSEMIIASVKGMLKEPVSAFLPHLHQPLLVLYGENDRLIPNKWLHPAMTTEHIIETAKKKMVHAQVKLLENCGHYLPFEVPGVFEDEVQQFWLGSEK
ncbi:MAG: alpha/beta hydrolase [Bacteroidota bacterium]|nr:alpha/beta hydrolase [Bacteroidota bacterium]